MAPNTPVQLDIRQVLGSTTSFFSLLWRPDKPSQADSLPFVSRLTIPLKFIVVSPRIFRRPAVRSCDYQCIAPVQEEREAVEIGRESV
jgi:hypothetical protein